MPSPAVKRKPPLGLSRSRPRQIRWLENARPFGRSDLISPRSDLADQSQPFTINPTAQIHPVVCISPSHFAPVRTSRPTRAVDLRSNGPHRSAFRPVRSYLSSVRSNGEILAVDP